MCDPAYSKNNLNFRLVFHRNLTLLLELVLNILYMPLGPTRGNICSQNDTSLDPRLQRSKHSNNSDRSSEQQDIQALG